VVQFNGITTVGITTGTGNDVVTVTSAPLDVQLSISTGGGSDTVNLGQSGGNELLSFLRHFMRLPFLRPKYANNIKMSLKKRRNESAWVTVT
jgi:hypothetical protein